MKQHTFNKRILNKGIALTVAALVLLTYSLPSSAYCDKLTNNTSAHNSRNAGREIIICLKAAPQIEPDLFSREYGLEIIRNEPESTSRRTLSGERLFAARVASASDVSQVLKKLNRDPRIDYAEERIGIPVMPLHTEAVQAAGYTAAGIVSDAELRELQGALKKHEIPDYATTSVKIALIDTGSDAEGVVRGYDFYHHSSDYSDPFNHGRHMKQIICSPWGGFAQAPIYTWRCANDESRIDPVAVSEAIDESIKEGVQVINCSFGTGLFGPSITLDRAMKRAQDAGILVSAACGNEGSQVDFTPDTWDMPYRVIVRSAAMTPENTLADISNWGHQQVEVASSGTRTVFREANGTYSIGTGTSDAAAWTTVALAFARERSQTWEEALEGFEATLVPCEGLQAVTWLGGYPSVRRIIEDDRNSPRDHLELQKVKVKKHKKLSLTFSYSLVSSNQSSLPAVIRLYSADTLLGFLSPTELSFSAKGKFPTGATLLLVSSGGGSVTLVVL